MIILLFIIINEIKISLDKIFSSCEFFMDLSSSKNSHLSGSTTNLSSWNHNYLNSHHFQVCKIWSSFGFQLFSGLTYCLNFLKSYFLHSDFLLSFSHKFLGWSLDYVSMIRKIKNFLCSKLHLDFPFPKQISKNISIVNYFFLIYLPI